MADAHKKCSRLSIQALNDLISVPNVVSFWKYIHEKLKIPAWKRFWAHFHVSSGIL